MKLGFFAVAALAGLPAYAQSGDGPAGAHDASGRQAGFYVGVGYQSLAISDTPRSLGFYAVEGRAGFNLNEYIAIEVAAAFSDTGYRWGGEVYQPSDVTKPTDFQSYGAYIVPRLPIGDVVGIYARLGYLAMSFEIPNNYASEGDGPLVGLGIGLDLGNVTINLDGALSQVEWGRYSTDVIPSATLSLAYRL